MKRTGFKRKPKKAKPKKPPKIKLPPKNAIGRLAWRMMSIYVRNRDNFTCFTCGKPGNEAGHYQHAGKLANWVSYDERNINCQCTSCNHYGSGNLVTYARNLVHKYGSNVLDDLDEVYRRPPMKAPDLIDKIKRLDRRLRALYEIDPYEAIGRQFQGTYKRAMEVNGGRAIKSIREVVRGDL